MKNYFENVFLNTRKEIEKSYNKGKGKLPINKYGYLNYLLEYELEDDMVETIMYFSKECSSYNPFGAYREFKVNKNIRKAMERDIYQLIKVDSFDKLKFLIEKIDLPYVRDIAKFQDWNVEFYGGSFQEEWDNAYENLKYDNSKICIGYFQYMDNKDLEDYKCWDDKLKDVDVNNIYSFTIESMITFEIKNGSLFAMFENWLSITFEEDQDAKMFNYDSLPKQVINDVMELSNFFEKVGEI